MKTDEKTEQTKNFCAIVEYMRAMSSTVQRVVAHCGKAASRVIAPSPAREGTLSEGVALASQADYQKRLLRTNKSDTRMNYNGMG